MVMAQYTLPFKQFPDFSPENFIISPVNQEAYGVVTEWPDWPVRYVLVTGPKKSGKTHLTYIFQMLSDAVRLPIERLDIIQPHLKEEFTGVQAFVLEDIESATSEEALLHFLNYVHTEQKYLLMTSSCSPIEMNMTLPDLRSRLSAAHTAIIRQPDEQLAEALLVKLMSDKQLQVSSDVLAYLLPRIQREYVFLHTFVEALDSIAMQSQKAVTIPLVRNVLKRLAEEKKLKISLD